MPAGNVTLAVAGGLAAPVGVSFGGAGFLIFYYIGIVEVLSKLGVLGPAAKLAGASSGALITTSHCSGLSPAALLDAGNALAGACRAERACSGSLDRHLRDTLRAHLPPGAWQRCSGSGWISISSGSPLGPNHGMLVGSYKSQEDLVDAAATSSFIPLWSSARLTAAFRGAQAFDGGYTISQPCPPGVTTCVRIASRNPAWPPAAGIGNFFSVLGRVGSVLDPKANLMRDDGDADAGLPQPPLEWTGPNGTADPALLSAAERQGVDIAPGVFHKVPWTMDEWSDMALLPASPARRLRLYELGKADAAAWARHVGLGVSRREHAASPPAHASAAAQQPKATVAGVKQAAAPQAAATAALRPAAGRRLLATAA